MHQGTADDGVDGFALDCKGAVLLCDWVGLRGGRVSDGIEEGLSFIVSLRDWSHMSG